MEPQIDEGVAPEFFVKLLHEQYSDADTERILAGCNANRPVTLRANTLKSTHDEVAQALDEAGIAWAGVPWYADAFVLEGAREKDVWELSLYQDGNIYVQSLSSMVPALVLDAQAGEDVLDMCAAPGGKTTQIAALGGRHLHVTACEMHAPRAEKLEHNLRKLGATNVTVMRTDARRLDEFFRFDRILVDAPCSGSGTLQLGESSVQRRFTPALIEKSRKAQAALLKKALSLLKVGGTLVYSTCSILACENEDIVNAALNEAMRTNKKKRAEGSAKSFEIVPIELDGFDDAPLMPTTIEGTLVLCPTELYEGFFVVKIKRTA